MSFLNDVSLLSAKAYVNGEWCDAASGKSFPVTNPATGETVGHVPDLAPEEVEAAIAAADAAFPGWAAKSAKERANVLRTWFDLIVANADDLAALMTAEQGKPLAEAKGEIVYGASFVEWFAEEGKRIYGDVIPAPKTDTRILVLKQPIGVVAAITPWNFPCAMITRKVAPALAAGCTVVVKPAGDTPLSALALAVLAERAGVPKGVLSIVTASRGAPVGKVMCESPLVRKLSFTGSTEVGKLLMRDCAGTVKKLSLELGGNAPFIVFDDADLDAAVVGAMASKYRNAGQTCVCANRFLVQDGVYDAFIAKFKAAVAELKVGNGTEPGVTQGPLINQTAVEKVESLVADAIAKGAETVCGGARAGRSGSFYEPTILAAATPEMDLFAEEIFGPVAPLFRFKDETEAIELANRTRFGLAAYFYGRDIGRIFRVAEALEYGIVGINEGLISMAEAPFGGVKESGLGREGSKYGIEDFLEIKYLCVGGLNR